MDANSSVIVLVALLSAATLSACDGGSAYTRDSSSQDRSDVDPASNSEVGLSGFSWVRPGELAGMPKPGGRQDLEADLAFLEREGIEVLFSLTETPTSSDAAAAHGIELIHVPVRDFTAPTQRQLLSFLTRAEAAIDAGQSVGVHCLGGHGRTGTFLAAWFIHEGMSADEALAEIRRLRPGSVETTTQEQALHELADFLQAG